MTSLFSPLVNLSPAVASDATGSSVPPDPQASLNLSQNETTTGQEEAPKSFSSWLDPKTTSLAALAVVSSEEVPVAPAHGIPMKETSASESSVFAAEDSPTVDSNASRNRSPHVRPIHAEKRSLHLAENLIIVPTGAGPESIPVGRSLVEKDTKNFPTGKIETQSGRERTRTESLIVKTDITGPPNLDPPVSQISTPLADTVNPPLTSKSQLSTESELVSHRSDSSPMKAGEFVAATNESEMPTVRSSMETLSVAPYRGSNFSEKSQVEASTTEQKTEPISFSAIKNSNKNVSTSLPENSEPREAFNSNQLTPSSHRSPATDTSSSLGSFVRSDTQSEPRASLKPEVPAVNPAPDNSGSGESYYRSPAVIEAASLQFTPSKSSDTQREIRTSPPGDSNFNSAGEDQIPRTSASVNVVAQSTGARSAVQSKFSSGLQPETRAVPSVPDATELRGSDNRAKEPPPIYRNPGSMPQPQIVADGSKGLIIPDADRRMTTRSPDQTEAALFESTSPRSIEVRRELMTSLPRVSHLTRHNESPKLVPTPTSLKVAAQFTGARSTEKEMTFEAKGSKKIIMQEDNKQVVKNYDPAVGINPAKPADSMPSLVQSPPSSLPTAPVTDAAPVTRLDTVRMIERIDSAAAHISAQKGQNVDLKIDLDSGQQLSVRITMQEGRMRAAFQTDHPALRESLASAWPTFVAQRESSATKWADPVFVAPVTTSAPTAVVTAAAPVDSGTNFFSSPQHEQPSAHDRAEREESSLRFATRSKLATPSNSGVAEKSDESVTPRSAILPGLRVFA